VLRKIVLLAVTAAAALAAIPTTVKAEVGDVISSFHVGSTMRDTSGVARSARYVTCLDTVSLRCYFYRYTPAGSLVARYYIGQLGYLHGASPCHLDSSYIGVVTGADSLDFYTLNGTFVSSINTYEVIHPGFDATWDGKYYYILDNSLARTLHRYTSAGSYVGTWAVPGWPASIPYAGGIGYLSRFANSPGSYFVVTGKESGAGAIMTLPGGSFVATFTAAVPNSHGAHAGRSSDPDNHGAVLWVNDGDYIYELDMGNGPGNAVEPASVGRVKALFR
jgi:hypothetical protein